MRITFANTQVNRQNSIKPSNNTQKSVTNNLSIRAYYIPSFKENSENIETGKNKQGYWTDFLPEWQLNYKNYEAHADATARIKDKIKHLEEKYPDQVFYMINGREVRYANGDDMDKPYVVIGTYDKEEKLIKSNLLINFTKFSGQKYIDEDHFKSEERELRYFFNEYMAVTLMEELAKQTQLKIDYKNLLKKANPSISKSEIIREVKRLNKSSEYNPQTFIRNFDNIKRKNPGVYAFNTELFFKEAGKLFNNKVDIEFLNKDNLKFKL